MLKRPSSSETEEDLLALQEQFLTSKKQPSAEVRRPQTGTFFSSVDQKSKRDVVTLKGKETLLVNFTVYINKIQVHNTRQLQLI